MGLSAVIVCCARSCGPFLPDVLNNIEAIAGLYERPAYVFVENDSTDDTKAQLRAWLNGRPDADLIEFDGLAERLPRRTERLAVCRNAYIDRIRQAGYSDRDHLVIFDADDINSGPIEISEYARARDWLAATEGAVAGFVNTDPIYYDILALRHPTWCPNDYWVEVKRKRGSLTKMEARQKYCFDRQIAISPWTDPIEVTSAFGGLGIYEMGPALKGEYVGVSAEDRETCEHVPFHLDIARHSGGKLFILPWMRNRNRSPKSINAPLADHKKIQLEQDGASCNIIVPAEHPIDRFRQVNPLYDRRLPVLARLVSEASPGATAMDVGSNVGDTVALCRLAGSDLHFVAIEASLPYLKFLLLNRVREPGVFRDTTPVWSFVGRPGDSPEVEQRNGTAHRVEGGTSTSVGPETAAVMSLQDIATALALPPETVSLVKIDTDGYDQTIILNDWDFLRASAPILWTEAQVGTPAQQADWARILEEGAETWPYVVAFDNCGFAYCAGRTRDKLGSCLDLISYARRHSALPRKQFGPPPIYYPDLALFPERFAGVFEAFCRELGELDPADRPAPEAPRPAP